MQYGSGAVLTARERQVLAASASGLLITEVAAVLGLSPETVRTVLGSAMAKLGARSKLEAIVIALKDDLIERRRS
jgi:DNA-binding CsgD family transcriptional regulator